MNDYERIAAVIGYLDKHHTEQPSLAMLAEHAGLSAFHFHRLFSRWAGITPKDFLQCLTLSHSKALLAEGKDVLNVALAAGLSGPSRLHDLCVNLEAASPGELKSGGADWTIRAGFVESPFGRCLVGESPRGICHFSFVGSVNRQAGIRTIQRDWPLAGIHWDDSAALELVGPLFQRPATSNSRPALRAFVRGTGFQLRVWRALLQIPSGTLVSYGELAAAIGNRSAARAVGSAVGQNPLAYLIPCHRVIRDTGALGNYRWGETRKKAIVVWESSTRRAHQSETAVVEK
jgi:AraC family transcriptional regulator, regulatory protein of adaptative response / methylated-DNA-[protein]-cysteine methyltransferase